MGEARRCGLPGRYAAEVQHAAEVIEILPVPAEAENIISDQIGFLPARLAKSRRNPMETAVRESKVTTETGVVLRIMTNDLDAPAAEIAALYKRRWAKQPKVPRAPARGMADEGTELFFRWIKQTLKIRHFYGTSENAVRIQIAVALIAFVLIRLAHNSQHVIESTTQFARLVRANVMHRRPIDKLHRDTAAPEATPVQNHAQGVLLWA